MKINSCLLILFTVSLAACQEARPTVSPAVPLSTPAQTPTTTRTGSNPTPTLSPRDIASSALTELSIYKTSEHSPNGRCAWERLLAFSLSEAAQRKYDSQFFTLVKITCEEEWILVEEWKEQNLGYSIPELLGWSVDGKYAYYYEAVIPDGCQPLGGFQQNLRQVELASRDDHGIPLTWTGGITLSPDSTKLVYYDQKSAEVGVYDLLRREEQRIRFELPAGIEYWSAGEFTWSPDGRSALFVINYGDACFPTGSSIRRVDIQDGEVSTVIDGVGQTLSIMEWTNPGRALISRDGKKLWLDPVSGRLQVP